MWTDLCRVEREDILIARREDEFQGRIEETGPSNPQNCLFCSLVRRSLFLITTSTTSTVCDALFEMKPSTAKKQLSGCQSSQVRLLSFVTVRN